MHSQLHLLPQRFPVGTRYVVEERIGATEVYRPRRGD